MEELYIEINRQAYDLLATQYDDRTITKEHEIKDDYWYDMLNRVILKKNAEILEIGPGSGRNLKMFENFGCNMTAVELSGEMCKVVKKRVPNCNIINKNILECEFVSKSFDIIFLMAVIHNFPISDACLLLTKIYDWLRDDGYLLIGTTIHQAEEHGIFLKEDYIGKIKRYRHRYTKEAFEKLILDNGFKIFESFIVEERERKKVWYDMICKK